MLDFYKEKGYRDARIISDSIVVGDNKIDVVVKVQEGNKYYFGSVDFIGNSVYSDAQLSRVMGIKPEKLTMGCCCVSALQIKQNQMVTILLTYTKITDIYFQV